MAASRITRWTKQKLAGGVRQEREGTRSEKKPRRGVVHHLIVAIIDVQANSENKIPINTRIRISKSTLRIRTRYVSRRGPVI